MFTVGTFPIRSFVSTALLRGGGVAGGGSRARGLAGRRTCREAPARAEDAGVTTHWYETTVISISQRMTFINQSSHCPAAKN